MCAWPGAIVLGRSEIVGKPMAALLLARHATVTVCHSHTRDLAAVCREADLLVAAAGKAALVTAEHVQSGAVVVDVGVNRVEDPALVARLYPGDAERQAQLAKRGYTLVGDVDFTQVREVAGDHPRAGGRRAFDHRRAPAEHGDGRPPPPGALTCCAWASRAAWRAERAR